MRQHTADSPRPADLRQALPIHPDRILSISEVSELGRYVDLVRAGETTTPQRLQIMLDQRERIVARIQQLELALTTTDYKIAKYGGAPDDQSAPHATDSTHLEGEPS